MGRERSGLYYTPVNTRLSAEEAAYVVDDCGATVLFAAGVFDSLARGVREQVANVRQFVAVGEPIDGYDDEPAFVAGQPTDALDDEREGSPMLYSSGTTGRPKGVRRLVTGQPYGTDNPVGPLLNGVMGFAAGKVYLTPAPLYHSAPLVWSMTVHRSGGTLVLMEHFGAQECLDAIDREHVSHAQFVPTMFVRMLKLPDAGRAALRRFQPGSGRARGGAVPDRGEAADDRMVGPDRARVLRRHRGRSASRAITREEWLEHPGSVGRAACG